MRPGSVLAKGRVIWLTTSHCASISGVGTRFAVLAGNGKNGRRNRGHPGIGQGAFKVGGVGVAYKVGNNARDGLCVVAGDADEIGEERFLRARCREGDVFHQNFLILSGSENSLTITVSVSQSGVTCSAPLPADAINCAQMLRPKPA